MFTIRLTRFQSLATKHLASTSFSFTESRLDSRISDRVNNVSNYCISGTNATVAGQTGIAVYNHNSIADIAHRTQEIESDLAECIFLDHFP